MDKTRGFNKVAYYYEMGLGKTFISSEKMKELGADTNLVFAQLSKLEDWYNHFKRFYPDYKILILRSKKNLDEFMKQEGKQIGILNYEMSFRRPILNQLKNYTLILDESSYIKNATAKRTKFISKLKYQNLILLSGTPVSGKYEEILSQIRMLGWKTTKKSFWNDYIIYFNMDISGFPIPVVTGYKNIDRLKRKLGDHGAIFMKTEEVIDLPDQIDIDINIKSNKNYRDFKKDSYIDMGDIELIGDNSLTQMLYERQLVGIYSKEKQKAFKEHLEGTEERVIVFYNFTEEYNILKEITKKLDKPISVINGKSRDLESYENKSNSVTFIQYQAGSKGLNLQKANVIIYYTPTLSAENYMQSKKRVHRIGQGKTCFYYFMKVKGSIESNIYNSLEKGEDYTNKLFEK